MPVADILQFALVQWHNDAALEIADAYKWLFHATQGGEHAITDEAGPRAWLDREWETLTPSAPDEVLIQPLRPDGALVRFHLRSYRQQGGDKAALLHAFIASATAFHADRPDFHAVWWLLGETLIKQPIGQLTRAEWERLEQRTSAAGYPAIHHSPAYEQLRRPAYRVLTGANAAGLFSCLHAPL